MSILLNKTIKRRFELIFDESGLIASARLLVDVADTKGVIHKQEVYQINNPVIDETTRLAIYTLVDGIEKLLKAEKGI